MNLHEYQGKSLLAKYKVPVPMGIVAYSAKEAQAAAQEIHDVTGSNFWVVKAQVHAGGRGKGGGVKLAKTMEQVADLTNHIIGMYLVTPQTTKAGKLVRKVLIQQDVYYPGEAEIEEFYVSILLDRATGKNMILYSPEGGTSIEEVAEKTPDLIFTETIDPAIGLQDFQCRKVAFNLGLGELAFKGMVTFIRRLYDAYLGTDASLFEINPVLKTSDNKIMAVDCKVSIDNNALFRHKDIAEMRDTDEEDAIEVKASAVDLNFVKMDGNVGCMVNGAGLAMATMDIIKLSGGEPANFLDVGGTADAKRVEQAIRIILEEPSVEAILINIFGGIVRCDRVAQGVVDAYKNIGEIPIPIVVRLQGTNAEEGKALIDASGLKVHSAIQLADAAKLVGEVLRK
jgi:succinyl-CoA synthetase beta subunit